jgi:putative salt-induced outer membrane protein YdiY
MIVLLQCMKKTKEGEMARKLKEFEVSEGVVRSSYLYAWYCIFVCFFAFVGQASADQVTLVNGDILTGTIEKAISGKLTLKTDYAGPVEIDVAKIVKVSSTSSVEIRLKDGEVLKGQIGATEEGKVLVERSGQREATAVEWKDIASINPPPFKWTGSITVAGNAQTGNTHRNGASVLLDASRRTATDRFSLGYQFNYAHENNAVTARNHYGFLKYDYFFTTRLYGFLSTELLSDTFRDLKLRVAVGPGVGYQVWDDPVRFLSLDAGLSYISEMRTIGDDQDFLSARLGGHLSYKVASFITFSDRLLIYPRLDHIGRYLLHNEGALEAPVASGWALKLANIIDRDSNPPLGTAKDDIQWILGLQYSF